MLSHADNDCSAASARNAMGDTMRRYWHPVCMSTQLQEADAAPLRVRLLGEDYIAFRDSSGVPACWKSCACTAARRSRWARRRGRHPLSLSRLEVRRERHRDGDAEPR